MDFMLQDNGMYLHESLSDPTKRTKEERKKAAAAVKAYSALVISQFMQNLKKIGEERACNNEPMIADLMYSWGLNGAFNTGF